MLRNSRGIILLVLLSLPLAPVLTRVLQTYRAVVLEVNAADDTMLLGFAQKPPRWVGSNGASPGDVVQKHVGNWEPEATAKVPEDEPILDLYRRYSRTYAGVITAIRPPVRPGGASVAVVRLDGGGEELVSLWADHLVTAAVGRRVEKRANAWDPVLVTTPEAAPAEPVPGDAPAGD